ncbi:hypothetical protein A3D05_03035 [Candidatus Gottesmanbacteria bacterium RIFCSPHIGHO2_02_FULL_40_24]|nr:MAG: hypothetical protein A3D05_03035 [Candidatus Gottesmanbacteria bacterium RIFCSPHIGHO2_02_FULL_40_24]
MKIIKLAGLVDIHVHFRDPGQTFKEDFHTGSVSALAGGITTVFDMPNNLIPVFKKSVLFDKFKIAGKKAVCDWGLYFGSVGDNTHEFEKVAGYVVGLKVYLSLTTGKYVVADEEKIKAIMAAWPKNKNIVFHAEGDRVDLIIKLTEKFKNKVHVTHINTRESLEKIIYAKKNKLPVTCDVTPHHLFLDNTSVKAADCPPMETVSNFVKPPLATKRDRDFLWENLSWIDCLVSDHAPHTLAEKNSVNPPPGVPGLETMLPLMLTAVNDGRLSLKDLIRLTSVNPRKIFGLSKDDSSYVEVDTDDKYRIDNRYLLTKCGWSPFHGWEVTGKIKKVVIRNMAVFENGLILARKGSGKNVSVIT